MSLQSRLNYRQAKLKRKLLDNRIKLTGQELKIVQLQIEEDKHGNRGFEIVSHKKITAVVEIPGQELLLWNSGRNNNSIEGSGTGIMDFLPVTGWFRFADKVAKGDLLAFKYLIDVSDNPSQNEYFIQVLQVSNKIGKLSNSLLSVRYQLAKFPLSFEQETAIKTILDNYKEEIENGIRLGT